MSIQRLGRQGQVPIQRVRRLEQELIQRVQRLELGLVPLQMVPASKLQKLKPEQVLV